MTPSRASTSAPKCIFLSVATIKWFEELNFIYVDDVLCLWSKQHEAADAGDSVRSDDAMRCMRERSNDFPTI